MVVGLRARRERKADPVAGACRLDAHEQETAARSHAHLGAFAHRLAQPCFQRLERRRHRGIADIGSLAFGHDAHGVFAADPADRLAPLGRVVGVERRAHRLQLDDLGVAELAREQADPVLAEEEDRREERHGDHREKQQRETAEQRARQQRHSRTSAESVELAPPASSSGTKT